MIETHADRMKIIRLTAKLDEVMGYIDMMNNEEENCSLSSASTCIKQAIEHMWEVINTWKAN